MLNAKKQVQLPADLETWYSRATAHSREAPLTHEIAFSLISCPCHKKIRLIAFSRLLPRC